MTNDSQSRKWQITLNNPIDKGYTHDRIIEIMADFKNCIYWCMSDEVGYSEKTFHTHIYIHCSGAVRFSTILNRFEGGHFEMCKGTSAQNRDYVFKSGKWKHSEKEITNIADSHYEFGDLPVERQGKRNDLDDLYDMIAAGVSNYDIIRDNPTYMVHLDKMDKIRLMLQEEMYKHVMRDVYVVYSYGLTGTGKTRSIYETHGFDNVYSITDYDHPWDGYNGQDVVVFEEFRSSLRLSKMLVYLDDYPNSNLPARYNNRVACYTKVYINSNIDLFAQYSSEQKNEVASWHAFLRRIDEVRLFSKDDVRIMNTADYINGFIPILGNVPF